MDNELRSRIDELEQKISFLMQKRITQVDVVPGIVKPRHLVSNSGATQGELFYSDDKGNFTNLGIGEEGEFLETSGGVPAWGTPIGYTLDASADSFSPADATTYYFGANDGVWTTGGNTRVYIPRGGVIKRAVVFIHNDGTLGSNETSTMSIRVNDATDYTISSSITTNSANQVFSNIGLSIDVSALTYFEIKWVTPTWATNPTFLYATATIYIE